MHALTFAECWFLACAKNQTNASSAPRIIPANSKLATRSNVRTYFFDQTVPKAPACAVAFETVFPPSAGGVPGTLENSTLAMKLYPRRGIVSIYTGLSGESPSTWRSLFIVVLTLASRLAGNVSGQSWRCTSERVTMARHLPSQT